MPVKYNDFTIPVDDDAILWRYMNLHKLFSLLVEKRLFFCRADKYADPFECSTPLKEIEFRRKEWLRKTNYNLQETEKLLEKDSDFFKRVKKSTVVNCWHINENESDAMWRIYLKTNEGVSIQSNYLRIVKAFDRTNENICASKVRYIDYKNDIWFNRDEYPINTLNTITPVIHKKKEYYHENEFRLFHDIQESIFDFSNQFWSQQENNDGKFFNVKPEDLIEKIIFAPTADQDCKIMIRKKVEELGYDFQFMNSTLNDTPLY